MNDAEEYFNVLEEGLLRNQIFCNMERSDDCYTYYSL